MLVRCGEKGALTHQGGTVRWKQRELGPLNMRWASGQVLVCVLRTLVDAAFTEMGRTCGDSFAVRHCALPQGSELTRSLTGCAMRWFFRPVGPTLSPPTPWGWCPGNPPSPACHPGAHTKGIEMLASSGRLAPVH